VRRTTPAPRGGNPPTDELRLDLGAAATLETPRVPVRAPLSPSPIEGILEPGAETDQAVDAVLPRVLAALDPALGDDAELIEVVSDCVVELRPR
jgi:hypothetical protein